MKKHFTVSGLLICAGLVQAHEGHVLSGSFSGHADETLVLIALVALAAAGLWLKRSK